MQKHPLLSVKEAAAILRLDERSVRERLINGQLKGEKKNVGLREKWFVYSGSVESARSKESALDGDAEFTDVTVESQPVEQDFAPETSYKESREETDENWIELNRDRVKLLAEEIVKPLMEKIENQAEVIFEQKRTITEQERQLRLLPDLQREAERDRKQAETKSLEVEALQKQIEALQAERTTAESAREEVKKAVQDELASLTKELQELKQPWWKKWFAPTNPDS